MASTPINEADGNVSVTDGPTAFLNFGSPDSLKPKFDPTKTRVYDDEL